MRIVAWVNKNSGPSYHRLIMPLLMMPEVDVFVTNSLLDEHFEKGCDIFMYNRVFPSHADDRIKQLQDQYGFKICVDIDDYWHLDESHILYKEYQGMNFAGLQVKHIIEANVVLTTHVRLADEIRQFNKNVHVIPNAIPPSGQFKFLKEPYYLVRLFWQGSDTHEKDIALLGPVTSALGPLSPKMKMVMAGYVPHNEVWHNMLVDYTGEGMHQYKLIPPAPVSQYYQSYKEADICLVPLVGSTFNKHKSNLKVLEAGNIGVPVIASEVHPYLGLPVLYASNTADWIRHIKALVKSKRMRRDKGLELREYCKKYFNFEKINEERKQILEFTAKTERV